MSFIAKRSGHCGHCSKPFDVGERIEKINPHRVKLPGRYNDWNRYKVIIVNYAHENCGQTLSGRITKMLRLASHRGMARVMIDIQTAEAWRDAAEKLEKEAT